MFTGLYPSQHGAFEGRLFLSQNIQHLVSALKMKGYRTFGISSNGLVSPASGLCRDFDFFKDFTSAYLEDINASPNGRNVVAITGKNRRIIRISQQGT